MPGLGAEGRVGAEIVLVGVFVYQLSKIALIRESLLLVSISRSGIPGANL